MPIIGLDVGGANLKAATSDGASASRVFEIWKAPERLTEELRAVLALLPTADALAVTMTAELADCFETKAQGVRFVLDAVRDVAGERPVLVWRTVGGFTDPQEAVGEPMKVAAANWHALATWAAEEFRVESGLLIDVGSTTTDIIALENHVPRPRALTDRGRLQSAELVYTGVRRTPLCALAASVPFGDGWCPLAAEFFASTLDIYLLLGDIAAEADNSATADGRPATEEAAHARLARMLCCDCEEFSAEAATIVAQFLAGVQQQIISTAVERVWADRKEPCKTVVVSGCGSFLANRAVRQSQNGRGSNVIVLAENVTPPVAEAACAYAVARLAAKLG